MNYWLGEMKMFYRTLASLSLIASAQLSANELDNLINSSQAIRDTFKYGIQAIGGMANYAQQGGIANSGVVDQGLIEKAKQDAYNQAVLDFKNATYTWDPNADQYFEDQSQQAMDTLGEAIDTYVDAATAVIAVTTVNEMAQDAEEAPDSREAIALQEYMDANDVLLDDQEVDTYNESLQAVEVAAQTAAAYMAVANDPSLLESANDSAYAMNVTYQESSQSFFDAATGILTVEWDGQAQSVALDMNSYYKADVDIITEGSSSMFYRTSPEGGCWFIEDQTERETCMYGS